MNSWAKHDKNTYLEGLGIEQAQCIFCPRGGSGKRSVYPSSPASKWALMILVWWMTSGSYDAHHTAQYLGPNNKSAHRSPLMCCWKGCGLVGDVYREKLFLKMVFFIKKYFNCASPLLKYFQGKDYYFLFMSIQSLVYKGSFPHKCL